MAAHVNVRVKTTKQQLLYRPNFALKGGPVFFLVERILGFAAQLVYREKLVADTVVVPVSDVAEVIRQALKRSAEQKP